MSVDFFYAWCIWASCLPFMVIVLILAHYALRRDLWRRGMRFGKGGFIFYPLSFALGLAFQFMQVFTRPSVAHVLQEKQKEAAEDEDNGDPDAPTARLKHFHRQLRRIRLGERIDGLVWRL